MGGGQGRAFSEKQCPFLQLAVEAVAGLVGGVEVGVHPALASAKEPVLPRKMVRHTYLCT
jgi:hypothetical protein